jgi:hypothetical protein
MPRLVLLSALEERKMASSTVLTTAAKAGKTPQKQKARPLDTFPAIFMTEIKRTIATESVSQFSSTDMSISDQNDKAGSYYHGTGAIVSQISKFLQGADKYGNIWVKEDTPVEISPLNHLKTPTQPKRAGLVAGQSGPGLLLASVKQKRC